MRRGLALTRVTCVGAVIALLIMTAQGATSSWPSRWITFNNSWSVESSRAPAISIATEGDVLTLFLIWAETNLSQQQEICQGQPRCLRLYRSADGGDTFDLLSELGLAAACLAQQDALVKSCTSIVAQAGAAGSAALLFVVWEEGGSGEREIYLSQSIDGGKTFSTPVNISRTPRGDSRSPALVLDGRGGAYIAWVDTTSGNEEILLQHFLQGELLSSYINISRTSTPSLNPTIAVAQEQLYVAWEEDMGRGNHEILFRSSAPFSEPMNLSASPLCSRNPALATDDDGNLFLVWEEEVGGGNTEIYLRRSVDIPGHRDLLPPIFEPSFFNLSASSLRSRNPGIALGPEGPIVVWEEEGEIVMRSSMDSFAPPINLSRTPAGISRHPAIAVLGQLVAVAWEEQLHGNWEILSASNQATTPLDLIEILQSARRAAQQPDDQILLAQAVEHAQRITGTNPQEDVQAEAFVHDRLSRIGDAQLQDVGDAKRKIRVLIFRSASLLTMDEIRIALCGIFDQLHLDTQGELLEVIPEFSCP